MSRTSNNQFEIMVDFMERNGDLNKPVDGPNGRLAAAIKWTELSNVLNLDTTGSSKPVEKWKKVWSDFKNNTKRKAAKISRAASGTGGGPACKLVLTDLEQRVLELIGTQAATGLPYIAEVGLESINSTTITTTTASPPHPGKSTSKLRTDVVGGATSPTPHHASQFQHSTRWSPAAYIAAASLS
ncbi:hypothetical protein evm_015641, partial [Chilo suppressalis]